MMGFDPVSYAMGAKSGGGGSTGGGVLVVHADMQTMALDKTWKEITDAPFAVVKIATPSGDMNIYVLSAYWTEENAYSVAFVAYDGNAMAELDFVATSETGYPVYNNPNP